MHGINFAPITGKLVAEMVTGTSPTLDTTPLRLERFR
jgi:D-amino-acid dehydrogenase